MINQSIIMLWEVKALILSKIRGQTGAPLSSLGQPGALSLQSEDIEGRRILHTWPELTLGKSEKERRWRIKSTKLCLLGRVDIAFMFHDL